MTQQTNKISINVKIVFIGVALALVITVFESFFSSNPARLGAIYENDGVLQSIIYAAKAQEINTNKPLKETTLASLLKDEYQKGAGILLSPHIYQKTANCNNLNGIIIRRMDKEEGIEIKLEPSVCDKDTKLQAVDKKRLSEDSNSIVINTEMPASAQQN